jgi:hypothetical protein
MRSFGVSLAGWVAFACLTPLWAQRPVPNPLGEPVFKDQPYQRPEKCLPCHQRQYDELHSSVKSGYRSVSPLMNGLESASNFIVGGALRPVYSDSTKVLPDGTPLNTNMFTTPSYTEIRQVQAGFCFSCHDGPVERLGNDPSKREVPELALIGADFRPGDLRPLRDYHMEDSNGNQILPATIGGLPPPGAQPSLGAAAITCDTCHNVTGPDLSRSLQGDGFANNDLEIAHTVEKIGPFSFPVAVKDNFHVSSNDPKKIAFMTSSAFCNACHDVRVPGPDLQHLQYDAHPGGQNVTYYRLENLSTEWQLGPYNSTDNPFGKVVKCQDCHMSLFPFAGDTTYQVGDMKVTTPTPAIYPTNYAAVPGVATDGNYPLSKREVVTHYFTGVDVPLMSTDELSMRLGGKYPDPYEPGVDEYGIPKALSTRREKLMDASVRINLDKTDPQVPVGGTFDVRLEAVALTGHRFPSGFSQERTAYVQLSVTDANGFVVYQSGYKVDKPHPETGEMQPDGNLDDESLEHIRAVVDPGVHQAAYKPGAGPTLNGGTNQVFDLGPDNGPDDRIFAGIPAGLVLFRNELTHIYLPGESLGRTDANGNPIVATRPHYEETFNAALANTVDNFRSLQPLMPRTYNYEITLPTQAELDEMGVTLKGPLQVHAQVNFEHFPPLFMRYLARVTGPNGPAGHSLQLVDESTIDNYLKDVRDIASADFTVNLEQ